MRRKSQPFDPAFYLFVNYILRYFPICKIKMQVKRKSKSRTLLDTLSV